MTSTFEEIVKLGSGIYEGHRRPIKAGLAAILVLALLSPLIDGGADRNEDLIKRAVAEKVVAYNRVSKIELTALHAYQKTRVRLEEELTRVENRNAQSIGDVGFWANLGRVKREHEGLKKKLQDAENAYRMQRAKVLKEKARIQDLDIFRHVALPS